MAAAAAVADIRADESAGPTLPPGGRNAVGTPSAVPATVPPAAATPRPSSVGVMGAEVQLPSLPLAALIRLPADGVDDTAFSTTVGLSTPVPLNEGPSGWVYGPPGRGLCAADGLRTPFSNYTSGFKALLDYVWFDPERIEVEGVVMHEHAGLCVVRLGAH